ncbi:class I SAM-dependent methyltransferase [Taibaiella sp. KBW10]|uniref:class I SAM-dependent methyltransferase n=1 Tax=Taibaiella sp. KBW10 TaxID=2153357 RepID=UPI00131543B1|nr:class I SAM-dependent methyltransferase [Taibaiella sp. KBW10]
MEAQENIPEFTLEALAGQLRSPSGTAGVSVGHTMHESNIAMTRNAFTALGLQEGDHILELGHGNGHHLKEILMSIPELQYYGLDISALMHKEATDFCDAVQLQEQVSFGLYDGRTLPFEDHVFDKITTVNTLYFWADPLALMQELYRVLKPGGLCSIAFVDKASMDQLPFTEFGFTKYDRSHFEVLMSNTPFILNRIPEYTEMVRNKMGQEMTRRYYVAVLQKP